VEPVEDDWIVGVARGEIPWFGLIKLWARGQTEVHPAPVNSGPNLMVAVALLLVAPFLAESAFIEYRKLHPKEESDDGDGEGGERKGAISAMVGRLRGPFSKRKGD
jgi:hypothetical protein